MREELAATLAVLALAALGVTAALAIPMRPAPGGSANHGLAFLSQSTSSTDVRP